MCGIIGYIGVEGAKPILINSLKKLEYRGYDSAGISVVNDNFLSTLKRKGRISELEKCEGIDKLQGNRGIAHTRWATHGEPNEINAHPHVDCSGKISIVHNGIIENHSALKKVLEQEGHTIKSDTDSEIIVHLIEKFYSGSLEDAMAKTVKCLTGAFGIAAIHSDEDNIVIAKRGSPLIIGISDKGMFVASDVAAILDYTKKVIYLNDNELAVINKDHYVVSDINGKQVDKIVDEITWGVQEIEKGGFDHFMLKEIYDQPNALENCLRGRVKDGRIKLSIDFPPNDIKRIVIVACGTSWHAALVGKYLLESMINIPVEVDYASEFRYRNPLIDERDVVIVISQSGETADSLAAIKEAKRKGAKTIGIVNVVGSTITREVDSGIYIHAGPEIGVASTKAFTCQIVALALFGLYLRQERGLSLDPKIVEALYELPEKSKKILESSKEIEKIAKEFVNSKHFLYLGRGINFPTALEGALKLKEISYIHAEGYPAAEMKHGPIALIDDEMPVFFIATHSENFKKIIGNMEEVRTRGGKIITLTDQKDETIEILSDHVIYVPKTIEILSPILNTIPTQLFAYHVSNMMGLDVDKPRNLAKSVTVE